MKYRCIIISVCLAIGSSTLSGLAFAHGTDNHGKTAADDARMQKLHIMMPMFSLASAKLESAIDKADAATVEEEAGKILTALPDLKKSKPHKNLKQQKLFVELASNLEKTVTSTVALVKNGDIAGAKTAFKRVEEVCAACHAKFRD